MKNLTCQQLKLMTLDQLVKRLGQMHQEHPDLFDTFQDSYPSIQVVFYERGGIVARLAFSVDEKDAVFSLGTWNLVTLLSPNGMSRMMNDFEAACPEVNILRSRLSGEASGPLIQQTGVDLSYERFGFIFVLFLLQKIRRRRDKRKA